jgi:hypothetical protein
MLAQLASGTLIAALVGGADQDLRRLAPKMAVGFGRHHLAGPPDETLRQRTGHQRGGRDREAVRQLRHEDRVVDSTGVVSHRRAGLERHAEAGETLGAGLRAFAGCL